jgi:hypothetical protein
MLEKKDDMDFPFDSSDGKVTPFTFTRKRTEPLSDGALIKGINLKK